MQGLERLEVDRFGLDDLDRRVLLTILDKFAGGPVGLNTLASALGEEKDTLEEIVEPYLMQIGFLERTPRGRTVTPRACEHLGRRPLGAGARASLFGDSP
jgi:Holliday junction DNA helicase RuvB